MTPPTSTTIYVNEDDLDRPSWVFPRRVRLVGKGRWGPPVTIDGQTVPSSFIVGRPMFGTATDTLMVQVTIALGRDQRWRATDVSISTAEQAGTPAGMGSATVDPADLAFVAAGLVDTVRLAVELLPRMYDLRSGEQVESAAATAWPDAVRRRPLRRDLTPDLLAEVAQVYRGASRNPRAAVADHFGVSNPTASRWIAAARDADLLPPAPSRETPDADR